MGLSLVRSRALSGWQTPEVSVEVHMANGLPSFTLVGLADTEVKEARERAGSAMLNSGLDFPHDQRAGAGTALVYLQRLPFHLIFDGNPQPDADLLVVH